MGRLGTVVVGSLTAPLGGTMAADTPDNQLPPVARMRPNLFDLNGWSVQTNAGRAWARADAAWAASGPASQASDGVFGRATFKNLAAHDVRVGMRWSFDDATLAN